jgi:cytochrome c-type biogenesis protein
MSQWLQDTALSGSMLVAVPIAVLAGLVSFFSPCVIPLLPGYLSYTTGLSGADLADSDARPHRGRMLAGSTLFVLGFSVVFVGLGVLSAGVSRWFFENSRTFTVVLGVLAVVLGLVFAGVLPLFQRDVRVHKVPAVGLAAAPLLGFLFALGWTPCIGPTLGVILGLAYGQSVARGGVLLGFYSLGLGLPFVVAALAWRRTLGALSVVHDTSSGSPGSAA